MKEISGKCCSSLPSGVFSHIGGSVSILSDNGTEFKNTFLTVACEQLGIRRLYSNPFHPQGN